MLQTRNFLAIGVPDKATDKPGVVQDSLAHLDIDNDSLGLLLSGSLLESVIVYKPYSNLAQHMIRYFFSFVRRILAY